MRKAFALGTHAVLAFLMMAACAVVARWAAPTQLLSEQRRQQVDLQSAVPDAFGDWKQDRASTSGVVNPQTQEAIDRIYDQVLSRTYVNSQGQRVMLSIAYGSDQRRRAGLQLHQPEVCYPAQGFELLQKSTGSLRVGTAELPVKRLQTALQRQRYEPITYWIMTGDYPNLGGLDRRKINLQYGLARVVPDGLLFRVSSIGTNADEQFALQARFVNDLLTHASPAARHLLAGL